MGGVVPPLLCLKEGLNGNGEDGLFDCDKIACDLGHYSETGSGNCQACKHGGSYLGSKHCHKELDELSTTKTIEDNGEEGIIYKLSFTLSILATSALIYFAVTSFLKRRRNRHGYQTEALPNYEI